MAKVTTSMSLDKETKEKATALFEQLSLDMSTAVGMFLNQCVRAGGLPFDVKAGPTAYEVVTELEGYDASEVRVGWWELHPWASKYIHYYMDNYERKETVDGVSIFHVMFAVMSIAREMYETPGALALDIASGLYSDFCGADDDDKELFDSLVVENPEEITYQMRCGDGEEDVMTVRGFPACTLNRIEQAIRTREGDDFTLSDKDIFNIIEYPLGWIYAIAKYRADTTAKNGRHAGAEDMEYFTNCVMEEILNVKRDYDMARAFPGHVRLGYYSDIDCNIPM